ncbi:6649_t:CDS:2 [Funneliformis mosseae]|uniref:protein-serine/threonine phosphatase n=1 Tax=Funneliformis mosseae TaxID=27381 RepID=A0A9N9BBD6_FUNMO|nr:6649_t:CDS:2 [Funneliformis mosseae]
MSDIPVKFSEEIDVISILDSSSSQVTLRNYDLSGLIIVSITTPGLETLYKPLEYMEDFVNVSSSVSKNVKYDIFAVYDGHGGIDPKSRLKKGGHEVAKECVNYLPAMIKETLKSNNDIETALVESFEKADKATIVLRHNNTTLYVANLGDSRAVICDDGKVSFETEDCNWSNPKEQERIGVNTKNSNYIIKTKDGDKKFIFNGKHLNGEKWNLSASRSLGDYHFKLDSEKPPVLARPKINKISISNNMKLILIASDGIWGNDIGMESEHFISKFIQIARKQTSTDVDDCLKETCKEFIKWCIMDHLKLEFKNHGDNASLIAIGLLNGQTKQQWFQDIQKWKGTYDNDDLILKDLVQNDDDGDGDQEDSNYVSDSESCTIDFTQI